MLTYHEIGGSPKEEYDQFGFSAQREFLIPWSIREEFVDNVLGNPDKSYIQKYLQYPGKSNTVATRLKIEPYDPGAIESDESFDLETDLPRYGGSCLKAVIEYQSIPEDDRPDIPETESGSWITYRLVSYCEEMEIPLGQWKWSDDGTIAVSPTMTGVKCVPITEHHLTWHQVTRPPWSVISSMQGKVNASGSLGCEPGTLLFTGAESNKLYRRGDGITDAPSAFTWQIKYVFREKSIKYGGNVFGWNHFYRESPPGWVKLISNGVTFYDTGNFDSLFITEP